MMHDDIERYWHGLAAMTLHMPYATIADAAEQLLDCNRRGGTVFVLGNGGSASTASHFACDLAKGTRVDGRPSFRVMPLTDNVAMITAWGNDTSYERVFAEQLVALVRPGDVVVIISASGNSPNVLLAAQAAHEAGASTIAMTGHSGGHLRHIVGTLISSPVGSIEQVEDVHLVIAHSLCVALRNRLQDESQTVDLPERVTQTMALELER
jgi:D-sedoheptulose 7-phosphate isomerase